MEHLQFLPFFVKSDDAYCSVVRDLKFKFMSHSLLSKIAIIGLIVPLFGCDIGSNINSVISPSTSADVGSKAIILTDVSYDPDSLIPETQPVADYLGANLKQAGINKGEVEIAPDLETVAEWMTAGKVNLYFDSVYPVMFVMKQSKATPILRRWKDGVAEYSTYFVARRDSGLSRVEDLQGKMIALEEPSSSSGFMFPMVYLLETGLNPVEKAEANHAVPDNEIGYVFSGEPENTVKWILEDKVSAGAIESETWAELSDEDRKQLSIIAKTDKFPRHVVLAGPNLKPEQIEALKVELMGMDKSQEGRAALEEFSETAKFDEFPEGAEAAISRLEKDYEMLQTYLAQQKK